MQQPRLQNHLRSHRLRSGLSQEEVAFLVGCGSGAKISCYERRARLPSLTTLLALEAVYQASARELFPGLYDRIQAEVSERTRQLARRWYAKASVSAAAPQEDHLLHH